MNAHVLGYEHGFVDMAAAPAGKEPLVPLPDFEDAYQTQRVLEAALIRARERCAIRLATVK